MLFRSIKGRFIGFALALSVTTLYIIFFTQEKIDSTADKIANNLSEHHQMQLLTHQLNTQVFDGYKSLNAFLIDPKRIEYKDKVVQSFHNAGELANELSTHAWVNKSQSSYVIQTLKEQLSALQLASDNLIKIRGEGLNLFPSIAIAKYELRPNRNEFSSAMLVTLFELNELVNDKEKHRIYDSFVKLNQHWMQIVATFRLYLGNSIGGMEQTIISNQEKSIDAQFKVLNHLIEDMRKVEAEGRLGFIETDAFHDMQTSTNKWFKGYEKILALHRGGYIRIDSPIIKFNIEPLLINISEEIEKLNNTIRADGVTDILHFSQVAEKQTQYIWLIGLLAILIILFITYSTESLVLKPISQIIEAMKRNSFVQKIDLAKTSKSQEIRDLVDTFSKMQSQVLSRQKELEHKALHDELTSLPNRTLLNDRIENAILSAKNNLSHFGLLIIDLDRFKEVNDTLGHHIGDMLLIEMSNRIKEELNSSDTIARLGGDEFAIVLPNLKKNNVDKIISRISSTIELPVTIDDIQLHIESSIGMAIYPEHGEDIFTLMSRADIAMYHAKRNNLHFSTYNPKEDQYSLRRLSLFGSLKEAIETDQMNLHYQPLIDVRNKSIVSVEALIRWKHKELGTIPSVELVTIAEQSGLISPLTEWVLNTAIAQCAKWNKNNLPLSIAINLSVINLHDSSLADRIARLLAKHQVKPHLLTLEITESAMMTNPKNALKTLNRLNNMGLTLAIDDFGTGFSSLSYLKQLPVKKLKIDKSFVIHLDENESDSVIVKSTIELAHNLGIDVIAEGIETEAVFDKLSEWGCDVAQGYFISVPQSAHSIESWIEDYEQIQSPTALLIN